MSELVRPLIKMSAALGRVLSDAQLYLSLDFVPPVKRQQ